MSRYHRRAGPLNFCARARIFFTVSLRFIKRDIVPRCKNVLVALGDSPRRSRWRGSDRVKICVRARAIFIYVVVGFEYM